MGDCVLERVEEGQSVGEREPLVDRENEPEGQVEGVEVAHLDGDRELLVVPLPEVLRLGLKVLVTLSEVEAEPQTEGLGLCDTLWLVERLLVSVPLTEIVPLLQ